MNASQIAENADARYILAMECKHTRGLRAKACCAIRGWDVSMDLLMVRVIGRGYFRKKSSDHFNNIGDWHRANLILALLVPLPGHSIPLRLGQELFAGKALDMRQITDLDAARGVRF